MDSICGRVLNFERCDELERGVKFSRYLDNKKPIAIKKVINKEDAKRNKKVIKRNKKINILSKVN